MEKFICKAMTPQGQIVKIKMEEEDKIACLKKLKRNGMTPIRIKKSFELIKLNRKKDISTATIYSKNRKNVKTTIKNNSILKIEEKVKISEIKEFTEDLYFLKQSNFTNSHALITIINKTENQSLKEALRNVLKSVEKDGVMYKAMREYNTIFPTAYLNFIKTGELTGNLEGALRSAIEYLKDEEKIKNKIHGELIPNIIAFLGILIVLILSLLIGVPRLQSIFENYGNGVSLPKITIELFKITKLIIKYWYILVIVVLVVILGVIKFLKTPNGKYRFDKFIYNNFLFGNVGFLLDFSRISRSLYLNLQENMKIQYALEICKNFISNSYMLDLIEKSINNVYTGKSWIEPFEKEKKLNPIIIELLKKANKLNSIETMRKSIEYLEKDIEKEIDKVLKKLPVITYGVVSIILLLFIFTILIPCVQVYLGGIFTF